MAITKEIKIDYINVHELKTLQIMGSTIIKDGEEVLAEKEYAFGLQPNQNPSDYPAYVNLPTSEKAKVDELVTALWNDEVKDNYATFLASQTEEVSESE